MNLFRHGMLGVLLSSAALMPVVPVSAQDTGAAPVAPSYLPDSASPFGKTELSADELAKAEMPDLTGTPTAEDEALYDK